MGLFTWTNRSVKNMVWYDISLVKLSTAAFILMIAALWPPIYSLDWYWYLVIGIVASIRPFMVMLKS